MSALATAKPLSRDASSDVLRAAGHTVIANLYQASLDAAAFASRINCIEIAHKVVHGGRAQLDSAGHRLGTDLLDKALLQQACTPEDVVTLCLVAADRMGVVEDNCERDFRPIADGVATALLNIAGFLIAEQGHDFVKRLAEPLREQAADCLDNYIWEPAPFGSEA